MDRSIEVDGGKRPITPSTAGKSRSDRRLSLSYSKEEEALNKSALDSEKERLARKQAREHARQLRMEERLRLQETNATATAAAVDEDGSANRSVLDRLRAETSTPVIASSPASSSIPCTPITPAHRGGGLDSSASSAAPSPMPLETSNIERAELRALQGMDGELETKYKDALLNIQKLQEHKVAVGYELEQFKDRSEDMQEDLAEAKAEIRQLKAQLRDAAAGGGSSSASPAGAAAAAAPAAMSAEGVAALKEERDAFKTDNASLRENVAALERMLAKCQADLVSKVAELATSSASSAASSAAAPTTTNLTPAEPLADGGDDAGATRLREQVKKLKAEKRELENKEDDLASQVRKLERESRRNEASLKAELDALREAYEKLRQRRNRQAGITADTTSA
eukprot:gene20922-4904_t